MRKSILGLFDAVLNDAAFLKTAALILVFAVGYQLLSASPPSGTLGLLALFLATALAEFGFFRPR